MDKAVSAFFKKFQNCAAGKVIDNSSSQIGRK
jgi:hypothetical protein